MYIIDHHIINGDLSFINYFAEANKSNCYVNETNNKYVKEIIGVYVIILLVHEG
jgi:hypothetical protein